MNELMKYLLLLLPVLFLSCSENKTQKMAGPAPKIPVEVLVLEPSTLTDLYKTSGVLQANEEVDLHPETSGRIVSISFSEGQMVKSGDLLVKLNDADLQAQLAKNKIQEKLAREDEARKKELLAKKMISQEEYDKSASAFESLKADQNLLKAQIAKTEIRAPFTGKIGVRLVSPGSFLSTASIVATLVDIDPLKVEFAVPERLSSVVMSGTPVSLTLNSTGEQLTAKVFATDSRVDPVNRSLTVKALVTGAGSSWIPGSLVSVSIGLSRLTDALLVPSNAIVPDLTGQLIYTVINGKVKPVPVQTGVRTETQVQITSGLSVGDSVIISGLMQIRKGSSVVARPAKPADGK